MIVDNLLVGNNLYEIIRNCPSRNLGLVSQIREEHLL